MTPKQNTLQYKGKRLWMFALFALLSFACAIVIGVIYQYQSLPKVQYHGLSPLQKRLDIYALDKPNVASKALMRWAALAATAVYTTDFVNYQASLDNLQQEYFTKTGYVGLMQSFAEIGFIESIVEKKLYITSIPLEAPVILETGLNRGRESWLIGVKLLVNYQTSSEAKPQVKIIKMLVVRVPTTEATKGIGIVQFSAADGQFG